MQKRTMMLDRTKAPLSIDDTEINFLKANTLTIGENQFLHYINEGEQEIVKIELVFQAGSIYQKLPLIASTCNRLIIEGTNKYTSAQIAEMFDREGAFLETECQAERASISLYCLTKSLKGLLPLLKEVIYSASFIESEIQNTINIQRQKFLVNSQKVAFQAKNNFLQFILSEDNVFNNKIVETDFDNINRSGILEFYKNQYLNSPFDVYASGKVDQSARDLICETFKVDAFDNSISNQDLNLALNPNGQQELIINQEGALQTAIRMGKPTIGRHHSDFPKLYLSNTILGGYFGSRLMTNIREDKGYTYGIGSGIVSYKNTSYFVISTEVGSKVTNETLQEINLELTRLTTKFVSEEELQLVKNYIKGSIMRGFDGAFAAMDRFKMLRTLGLDYTYYDRLLSEIKQVNPSEINDICNKYLNPNSMKKVLVGKI